MAIRLVLSILILLSPIPAASAAPACQEVAELYHASACAGEEGVDVLVPGCEAHCVNILDAHAGSDGAHVGPMLRCDTACVHHADAGAAGADVSGCWIVGCGYAGPDGAGQSACTPVSLCGVVWRDADGTTGVAAWDGTRVLENWIGTSHGVVVSPDLTVDAWTHVCVSFCYIVPAWTDADGAHATYGAGCYNIVGCFPHGAANASAEGADVWCRGTAQICDLHASAASEGAAVCKFVVLAGWKCAP